MKSENLNKCLEELIKIAYVTVLLFKSSVKVRTS